MADRPQDLFAKLREFNQEHLLIGWEGLSREARQQFEQELGHIDWTELRQLYASQHQKSDIPHADRIASLPRTSLNDEQRATYRHKAESAFQAGEVAFLVVAGGQGSRLGFEQPKGMFSIGPISKKSLFQIHAEKILALNRRYGRPFPFLIMTSPATDAETRRFFADKGYFGLPEDEVYFFCQGTMPALDLDSGKLLLEAPGKLFLSPNGHGGSLTGLAESGLLSRLIDRGIRTLSFFQVDNPLTNLGDFLFLGQHLHQDAEVSSKVLPKAGPTERVGNIVLVDGRCSIIEYSDLPEEWSHQTDAEGQLRFWAANPAIHLFDLGFLDKMTRDATRIPWHLARKKVPYLDEHGLVVSPSQENALKFERFIFDVLPQAERWAILETDRAHEFAPVKNAEGNDSPRTAQAAMMEQARTWLQQAGIEVGAQTEVEISPLFALDAEELATKASLLQRIDDPTYLE